MFFDSLQVVGGLACGAVPAPEGPRHVGHTETSACANEAKTRLARARARAAAAERQRGACFMGMGKQVNRPRRGRGAKGLTQETAARCGAWRRGSMGSGRE